jgi:hypothetical protein
MFDFKLDKLFSRNSSGTVSATIKKLVIACSRVWDSVNFLVAPTSIEKSLEFGKPSSLLRIEENLVVFSTNRYSNNDFACTDT